MDELATRVVPDNIRKQKPMSLPDALSEVDALAELKTIASKNQLVEDADWAGLLPYPNASGHPANRTGKPSLVHSLYTLSARNLLRSSRGPL